MMRYLLRLLFVYGMLCHMIGSGYGAKAQSMAADNTASEKQISRHEDFFHNMAEEPQSPIGTSLCSPPFSHRVASSRPARLLPTYGGKNSHSSCRCTSGNIHHLSIQTINTLRRRQAGLRPGLPSPRFYYVIALRRILC